MAIFRFTVNRSFLVNRQHPITVPRSQVPYRALEAEGLSHDHIKVIFPQAEQFEGKLYYGEAGFGEYYQLQLCGENRTLPCYIQRDDQLLVALLKDDARSYAVLKYCG